MKPTITAEQVRDIFDYSEGILTWRDNRGPRARKGQSAGTTRSGGYRSVMLDGHRYQRGRLVFTWHNCKWPKGELRHVDGDRGNDRIENLLDLDIHTLRHLAKGSTTLPGARLRNGRWTASINVDGDVVYLGTYATEWEAHRAFQRAHVAVHANSPYAVPKQTAYTICIQNTTGDTKCSIFSIT